MSNIIQTAAEVDISTCINSIVNSQSTWFWENTFPWLGILAIGVIIIGMCCCCFTLCSFCLTENRQFPPRPTELGCMHIVFLIFTLAIFVSLSLIFYQTREFTENYDSASNSIQGQFDRVYSLALVANTSANLFGNNIDLQDLYDIVHNIKSVSQGANDTLNIVNQSVYAVRDFYIILFAIPVALLLIAFFAMMFRIFFLVRIFMVVAFIFVFLFGLACVATSVPYSLSNHICDTGENLIKQTTELPSSCISNTDTFDYLNQCLNHNVTNQQLLEDLDIQDLFTQIQETLYRSTSKLTTSIYLNTHCSTYNVSADLVNDLSWGTAGEIASSEQIIQSLQTGLQLIGQTCSRYQTDANLLSQEFGAFGALLQIVNCGPLSAFYQGTVETTICQDFNNNLLFISICIAAVIIMMIPILMISFKFGFRPWTSQPRQQKVLLLSDDKPLPPPAYQSLDTVPPPVQFAVNVPTQPGEPESPYPEVYYAPLE